MGDCTDVDIEDHIAKYGAKKIDRPNDLLGSVVRVDENKARIRGTSEFALHAVLDIEGDEATVALIGDNCLAVVPITSLIRATTTELRYYMKSNANWDTSDVRLKLF